MGWALALNPNNEGNQYISSIDINSQSGNPNPVWNLKFKLSAGSEVSGFYRIAAESIGNVSTNRILLAADLSEIRFYRGTTPKTFSLSGASVDDIFEFDSDGTQLECLVNGVSQGFIAGATGVTLLNFGANFGNYSNMELEYVNYTTTDDTNLNRNYDATASDHNSLILTDITGNDTDGGSFNNMTTANWIDLGGGGTIVEFTFSISSASNVSYESAFIVSRFFNVNTNSEVTFQGAKVQSTQFNVSTQSALSINSAKVQASTFDIDTSSVFTVLTGDTNIVEFTFSINSSSNVDIESAKVQAAQIDINSDSEASFDSAKIQSSEFQVESGSNVNWNSSAIQGRTFAIDSESVFTVIAEGGEPVFIIGLTLALASDIITLELSSEQDIRELA